MRREHLATVVSEVFSPWVINCAFFVILGAATGAWLPAAVAAIGTGPAVMVVILVMMRTGKVGNHHVTKREQRGGAIAAVIALVLVVLGLLMLLDTPHLIWAGMASALVFLLGFGAVTVLGKVKASIHVGLWMSLVTFLGLTVSPWSFAAYAVTPLNAWSRIVIKHHTVGEVLAGVATGAVVTTLSVWWFLT